MTQNKMAGTRRIEEIPVSLEVIRRRVMMAIHAVERETGVFMQRYMSNVGEPDKWPPVVNHLCGKVGKPVEKLEDFKDLEPVLNKVKTDPEVARSTEYVQLKKMVERGKMFEYIGFSLRNDLMDSYEKHLQKYCLSFEPEGGGLDLRSVRDYENKIIVWRDEMKQKLDAVDMLLDESDTYKTPLMGRYVFEYDRVLHIMETTCSAMVQACEPMKKWVSYDSTYARKVQEEISQYNKRKMDMRDVINQLVYHRDQLGLKLRRRSFFALKIERTLHEERLEKAFYKRRENIVRENQEKMEAEIFRKRRDLDEVKSRIHNRKENSPTVFNYLTGMAEALREDIWKLEGKLETSEQQRNSLRRQQLEVQKRVDRLAADLEESNRARDQALARLAKHEHDVKLIRDDVRSLNGRIGALKRIREIKLHSDTVKKIHHFGYNPGKITEIKDDLQEAFKITAEGVGKDWQWLYQKLPFVPPRDVKNRSKDLEVIDLSQRRVDGPGGPGFHLLAMKSLEKWRRLSNAASLDELLHTLRRLRKGDTVKRIQRQVVAN